MPDNNIIDYTNFDPAEWVRQNGGWYTDESGNRGNLALESLPMMGLGGLFGHGDEPSWRSYYDPEGMGYLWADPRKANPVPLSTVPGTNYRPSRQYRQTAESVRTLVDLLPYMQGALAGQQIPDALAALKAAQAVSPGYQQLQLDLLKQFGIPLAQEGNKINLENALAAANRDKSVLEGPGKELLAKDIELLRTIDPEFFKTRELTSGRLGDLMNSIDLSGALSGSERAEIERSLAQENLRRGTANAPSNLDTVSNAMRFGEAGHKRQEEAKSDLSKAIAAATAFLPQSRTGIDPLQVATGRSSVPNQGQANFIGTTKPDNTSANNAASSLFNATNQGRMLNQNLNSQQSLAQKDWADYLNQVTSSIGNVVGMFGV